MALHPRQTLRLVVSARTAWGRPGRRRVLPMRKPDQLPPKPAGDQNDLLSTIDRHPSLKDSHKRLLTKILFLDRPGGSFGRMGCYATDAALAAMLGWSIATLKRRMKEVREWGFVVQIPGAHSTRYRRVQIPSGIVLKMDNQVERAPSSPVERHMGIEEYKPSYCPSEGEVEISVGPDQTIAPPISGKPDRWNRPREHKGKPLETMMALPIEPLWELFDKSEVTPRLARKFMTAWHNKTITAETLPAVVDHVITHLHIVPKEGESRLGDIGSLWHFINSYDSRRDRTNFARKSSLMDRARALGDLQLVDDIDSTSAKDYVQMEKYRKELLQLN